MTFEVDSPNWFEPSKSSKEAPSSAQIHRESSFSTTIQNQLMQPARRYSASTKSTVALPLHLLLLLPPAPDSPVPRSPANAAANTTSLSRVAYDRIALKTLRAVRKASFHRRAARLEVA